MVYVQQIELNRESLASCSSNVLLSFSVLAVCLLLALPALSNPRPITNTLAFCLAPSGVTRNM